MNISQSIRRVFAAVTTVAFSALYPFSASAGSGTITTSAPIITDSLQRMLVDRYGNASNADNHRSAQGGAKQQTHDNWSPYVSATYSGGVYHTNSIGAPKGGYNEVNHIMTLGLGAEYTPSPDSPWSFGAEAGYTTFENSHFLRSEGPYVAGHVNRDLLSNIYASVGAGAAWVDGYEGVIRDEALIGGRLLYVFSSAGVGFDLGHSNIEAGVRYIPSGELSKALTGQNAPSLLNGYLGLRLEFWKP
ncbi:MAG: hypothetical protein AAF569_00095 [Pseudomonadota bacterium]